jgi:hypothetical protein
MNIVFERANDLPVTRGRENSSYTNLPFTFLSIAVIGCVNVDSNKIKESQT